MFSKLLRRIHLYLALFLAPWMLMYALSTLVMNHRAYFVEKHGRGPAPWLKERELTYEGTFAPDAAPRDVARQLLDSLDLDGAHQVSRRNDGVIVIQRQDLLSPRRITYTPATRQVLIERTEARTHATLERFHRRRGYSTGYLLDTFWAVSVDLVIAACLIWALSGLWMWWEMKATRRIGATGLAGGIALFAFYLITI
ncbi:MAG: PepSY-associated TM helix domain-containing protein [Verrucomicrobia bacterium]|jgi:hypothetical protein|nr:PepSY-associated TM helix domain-containing protein [Verrucomicrobiota bacterium]